MTTRIQISELEARIKTLEEITTRQAGEIEGLLYLREWASKRDAHDEEMSRLSDLLQKAGEEIKRLRTPPD